MQQIQEIHISKLKLNQDNPRNIRDEKFKKLVQSIKDFPQMMQIRPIVVNEDMVILGGNMRYRACQEAGIKEIPIIKASDLTPEQEKEFIIKDNVGFGEWDWEELANTWDAEKLESWGMDLPSMTETEKLSKLEYESIYYEPDIKPNIKLLDCVNTTKFDAKIEYLDSLNLSDDIKNTLKLFAYRFIKIDFESVASYYAFNATEEEKKAIERLRLVLVDGGIDGFIEDDLLRAYDILKEWNEIEND